MGELQELAALSAGASVERGVEVETTENHGNRAAIGVAVSRLVFAQHGRVVNGVKVPCRNTRT